MQPNDVVSAARQYVGVRFRHQGRTAEEGLDCLGLLIVVSHRLGLRWPKTLRAKMRERDYSHLPNEAYLRESLELFLQPSRFAKPEMADIALMRIEGRAQHLGIIAQHPVHHSHSIIHAYAPARKVVEHRLDDDTEHAIVMRYRLPQLAEN